MRLMWLRVLGLGLLAGASLPLAYAKAPKMTAAQARSLKAELATLKDLLEAYKRYPEYRDQLKSGSISSFESIDFRLVEKLDPKALRTPFEFKSKFVRLLAIEQLANKKVKKLEEDLVNTPLSDTNRRTQLELNRKALLDQYNVIRQSLFHVSVEANETVLGALSALSTEAKESMLNPPPRIPPKIPGIFGGSVDDRRKTPDSDKINLTPVDPEFYKTQLGKKMESDLGGRADFWSYDYDKDELYVVVGDEISKVRVKGDGAGARIIQTRVGSNFEEFRGSDTRVEAGAKGRFLTGDGNQETLFGRREPGGPVFVDESLLNPVVKPGGKPGDHGK